MSIILGISFFLGLFLFVVQTYPMPPDVKCDITQWCDTENNECAPVCKKGTLQIDPWLSNALKTQRKLTYDVPFCYAQLPGGHNSAITLADGYGVDDQIWTTLVKAMDYVDPNATVRTNDQWFSLMDQLNLGARMLELDTHWVDDELRIAHCGGLDIPIVNEFFEELNRLAEIFGYNVTWDTETMGCNPSLSSIPADMQRSLESAFQEITSWMQKPENQNEFLVLFFDDQPDLKEWGVVDQLIGLIQKYFGTTVFTPNDKQRYTPQGWTLSINQMLQMGKKVIFVSRSDYGGEMNSTVFARDGPDVCNWNEPDYTNFQPFPNCQVGGSQMNNGQILRMPTCDLVYGPLDCGFNWGSNTGLLTPETIPPLVQCNFNIPSPDLIDIDKMKAYVWSWAEGEPQPVANHCTVLDQLTSRWTTFQCDLELYGACRNVTNHYDWTLSPPSPFAKVSCPKGYEFHAPSTAYENGMLATLLTAKQVALCWLNYDPNSF